MKDELDVHIHTYASGHAYSTMREVIEAGKRKKLKLIGISDHGPKMPGSAHEFYFMNLKAIPREVYGIKLIMGAELNIIDYEGRVDLPEKILKSLDYAIVSLHQPCIKSGTLEENTSAIIAAMKKPKVKIIGHPDNPQYPIDYERVAQAAFEENVIIEINNSSYNEEGYRAGSRAKATEMLKACKRNGTAVIMGSDAHVDYYVGEHKKSIEVLEENNYPEELIMNTDVEKFLRKLRGEKDVTA